MLADRILFLDGEAMVIDKPAGLPCDPPRDGGLSLENHLSGLTFGFQRWPVAVHRLDRDTSGCLLLARNPKAGARFAAAFENRQVGKVYHAVLTGVPVAASGRIEDALIKTSSEADGWRMVSTERDTPGARRAVTDWAVVAVVDGRALVAFRPATGRTHQLRVHAATGLGHAIVGDPLYGEGGSGRRRAGAHGRSTRTLLHASAIRVERGNKPPIIAKAPMPADMAALGFDPALCDQEPARPDHGG